MRMMIDFGGGVDSCPKVRFGFDHVHLSEPMENVCLEAKIVRSTWVV